MKKLLLATLLLVCLKSMSQSNNKEEVYAKIESSYAWLNFKMLETFATINMTDEQWAWVLKNDNYGVSTINGLGSDMVNYYEAGADSRIGSDCRYSSTPECIERIKKLDNTMFVEINATNVKLNDSQMKLAMMAVSSLGGFIGNNNIYGTRAGWKPKGSKTKFILNFDNGNGQAKVSWNKEGTVAIILAYVGSESPDWIANMLKKLHGSK